MCVIQTNKLRKMGFTHAGYFPISEYIYSLYIYIPYIADFFFIFHTIMQMQSLKNIASSGKCICACINNLSIGSGKANIVLCSSCTQL